MEHVSERLHTADTLGSTHAERSPEHEKGRDDRDSELGYVQERHEPRRSRAAAPVDPAHAAREQVKENSGREVQAHLLEVERSAKQHGPEHLVPASDCGDGMQRQTERDGIVLEVAVVDQDRGGCCERQDDATKHATLPRRGILRCASPFGTLEDVRERKTGGEKHGDVEREHLWRPPATRRCVNACRDAGERTGECPSHRHAHVRFVGCGLVSARRVQRHRRRVERRRERAARERHVRGQRRVVEPPVSARRAAARQNPRKGARAPTPRETTRERSALEVVIRRVAVPIADRKLPRHLHPVALRFVVTVHGRCGLPRVRMERHEVAHRGGDQEREGAHFLMRAN